MSNFALQFVPEVDPQSLTMRQRVEMAKRGELKPSEESLRGAKEMDDRSLRAMGIQTETGLVDQGTSGLNEGLAQFAGFPVDMATAGINAVTGGINKVAGTEIPQIEDPAFGSEMNKRAMANMGMTSQMKPQNISQRYARRMGQEVGFGVPMAATGAGLPNAFGAAARSNLPAYMATSTAADAGAGAAGQTSREIAPKSDVADFLASMAGGTAVAGAMASASRSRPPAPTRDDIARQTDELYERTKGVSLTDDASQNYLERLRSRMDAEGADGLSHPKAAAQLRKVEKNPRMDVYGVEQARRRMRDNVARDPSEGHLGGELLQEIDDYLKSLQPTDVASGNADDAVSALQQARAKAHTGIKYDETMDALDKAERTAANSGTGGNILNRQSQEIGKFYDAEVARRPQNKRKAGGYTDDEISAMEKIVYPGRGERLARQVGRLSPTSGGLMTALHAGAMGAGGTGVVMGQPASALAVTPMLAGTASQMAAERAKNKHIQELLDTILRGGTALPKKPSSAVSAALAAQLLNASGQ